MNRSGSGDSARRYAKQQSMDKTYWLARWERQDIGFHQAEINPYLRQYWPSLCLDTGSTVLVPLCGKSADLLWLRQQQYAVLGVELSAAAAQAFFAENRLHAHCSTRHPFVRWQTDGIDILCGDFFDLRKEDVANISAVYDRAALIALPSHMRKDYVRHLMQILPPDTPILLITLEYPTHEMNGPPFSVTGEEVRRLFSPGTAIELLHRQDVLEHNPKFRARGLSQLQENVFLLRLRMR